jgi:hypothetical protein
MGWGAAGLGSLCLYCRGACADVSMPPCVLSAGLWRQRRRVPERGGGPAAGGNYEGAGAVQAEPLQARRLAIRWPACYQGVDASLVGCCWSSHNPWGPFGCQHSDGQAWQASCWA